MPRGLSFTILIGSAGAFRVGFARVGRSVEKGCDENEENGTIRILTLRKDVRVATKYHVPLFSILTSSVRGSRLGRAKGKTSKSKSVRNASL